MPTRRLLVLVLCLVGGAGIGLAVERWWGSGWGYVAIPLLIGVAWLRVADPSRCEAPPGADRTVAGDRPPPPSA